MFAGTALSVRVFVYAGLSLFIINGPYLYAVVCILYAYNLTVCEVFLIHLKLRRVVKRKKNNLNKSYVHLHENLKENSYFL